MNLIRCITVFLVFQFSIFAAEARCSPLQQIVLPENIYLMQNRYLIRNNKIPSTVSDENVAVLPHIKAAKLSNDSVALSKKNIQLARVPSIFILQNKYYKVIPVCNDTVKHRN